MTCAWCQLAIEPGPRWIIKGGLFGVRWRLHNECAEELMRIGLLDLNRDAEYQSEGAERGTPL